MKHSCLSSRTLGKVAFSILSLAVLSVALTAQTTTEVQIMVAGPWDYVEDPTDSGRVVVVVPAALYHNSAQIFSGGDAPHYLGKTSVEQGIYRLDICDQAHTNCDFPQKPTKPCTKCDPYRLKAQVQASDVKAFLNNTGRYAISMPKPHDYTSYDLSQAIISTQPITDPYPQPETRASDYTTWMVLRYQVTGNPVARLTGTADDGTITYMNFITFVSAGGPPAISIVQAPLDKGNDPWCDSYSAESFHHSRMNWKLNLYALFPQLTDVNGTVQDRDNFDYTCSQTLTDQDTAYLKARSDYRETLNELDRVSNFLAGSKKISKKDVLASLDNAGKSVGALFRRPSDRDELRKLKNDLNYFHEFIEDKKGESTLSAENQSKLAKIFMQLSMMMAGATDCRKAQMSINGVIP
jgi:hypothetical protein